MFKRNNSSVLKKGRNYSETLNAHNSGCSYKKSAIEDLKQNLKEFHVPSRKVINRFDANFVCPVTEPHLKNQALNSDKYAAGAAKERDSLYNYKKKTAVYIRVLLFLDTLIYSFSYYFKQFLLSWNIRFLCKRRKSLNAINNKRPHCVTLVQNR